MKKRTIMCVAAVALLLQLLPGACAAQQSLVEVIDTPTANSIELGDYTFTIRLYDHGSILTRLYYGIIMRNLTLGLSFDAENVVGTGDIEPRRPYLYIKFPLYTGDYTWPAVCLGFDEQGLGMYDDDANEYEVHPMGFYLVLTKPGLLTGLEVSGGANSNYSIVDSAEKKVLGFFSLDYMVGPEFMLLGEIKQIASKDPYGTLGAKYLLNPELHFELSLLNVGGKRDLERIIRIMYSGSF